MLITWRQVADGDRPDVRAEAFIGDALKSDARPLFLIRDKDATDQVELDCTDPRYGDTGVDGEWVARGDVRGTLALMGKAEQIVSGKHGHAKSTVGL